MPRLLRPRLLPAGRQWYINHRTLMRKEVGCPILDWRLLMTNFRLDVSKETGAATLWMVTEETACGYKPILEWPDMDSVKEFAQMLLDNMHLFTGGFVF